MRIACTLLLALIGDHATAVHLRAQEPEQVSGEVTCAECVVTLDTLVTIGGFEGPGLDILSRVARVAVDRRGRILVWAFGPSEISVFDSTGRYVQTIGGRGEGPGEYGLISHIGVGPRYIHVFEYHDGRTMLDHDFQVVRTDRIPAPVQSAAVVGDDMVVFSASARTPGSVGHRLHMLRSSGELSSHGYEGGAYSVSTPFASPWLGIAGREETVWVVTIDNRLVRWDLGPTPTVGRVLERRVAEFDEGGDARGPAVVNAAMLDDRGLWIVWHSSDLDLTEPPAAGESGTRPQSPPVNAADGWLDLVDPTTGRTLARYHQDATFVGFAEGSSYVVAYEETDAGVPFLHILEPRLSRVQERVR